MSTPRPIVLITGANSGIGLEAVKAFLASPNPYHILFGSRSVEKGEQAIKQAQSEFPDSATSIELVQVDLTSDESIQTAFEAVSSKHHHIDALVNNAGGQFDHWLGNTANTLRETMNLAYDVNVAGTHVLTHTFTPLLLKSPLTPRLLFITSGLSSLTTASTAFFPPNLNHSVPKGWPKEGFTLPIGYRCSKAALNMLMLGWKYALEGDGVKVWSVSPGFLATNLGGNVEMLKKMGAGDPALGGTFIKDIVDGKRDGDHGKVIRRDEVQAW
ncbi:short chain dehydrogenase [Podospora aff. communis PSN243]|uniref:Short chain dehydrogenase n=1 Tax=Podospora aff. communis PSN243 TaxID=3040156 RepID=A0AAV9G5E3_9PEZI|nr:short chain dehydrogenase [Podospora aff. communis PSN243]